MPQTVPPPQGAELLFGVSGTDLVAPRYWGRFFTEYAGKDKFARGWQFYLKAFAFYAAASNPDGAKFAKSTEAALSLHRKTLKLFKWLNDIFKTLDALKDGRLGRLRQCINVVACGAFIPHAAANNLVWSMSMGLLPKQGWFASFETLKKVVSRSRFTVAVAQLMLVAIDWAKQQRDAQHDAVRSDPLSPGDVKKQHNAAVALKWSGVKCLADFILFAQLSAFWPTVTGSNLSDGVVGICGMISSAAGSVPVFVKGVK